MPSAATDSMVKVTLTYRDSGIESCNVLHGLVGDGAGAVIPAPTAADLREIGQLAAIAWRNTLAVRLANSLELALVEVVQTNPASPVGVALVPDTTAAKGQVADASGIQAVAGVVRWKTGVAVKGANGRTYLPGIPSSDTDDGRTFASTRLALHQTNAAAFYNGLLSPANRNAWITFNIDGTAPAVADLADHTLGIKVLHRAGALAGTYSDVTAVQVASELGIQRRRMK